MAFYPLKRLYSLAELTVFVAIGFYSAFLVLLDLLTFRMSFSEINTTDKFSSKVFGKVWLRVSSMLYKEELETDVPKLVGSASGVVVELGPGSGNQVGRYDKSKVTKIFGIEPNPVFHSVLQANIRSHGLQDIYTIVPCGIEDVDRLSSFGLTDGSVDTVLSVQVLCGVPEPRQMIGRLYKLLKPGGRMVVYEHVRAADGISRGIQNVFQTIWPYLMGGCDLNRPTGDWLLGAGMWDTVDLKLPEQEDPWLAVPHTYGTLVKPE